MAEQQLHIQMADYLRALEAAGQLKCQWFHPANGEYRPKPTAARLKRMGLKPGIADLIFMGNGIQAQIEIKAGKGRLTESQKAIREECEKYDIDYHVVRSLDDLQGVLKEVGAINA